MSRTRISSLFLVVLLSALLPSSATALPIHRAQRLAGITEAASNDYRCFYGPGIQVWEHADKGGRSMILCGNHGRWDSLGAMNENLGSWDWNDRISSFETFNTSAGVLDHGWKFCTDNNRLGVCTGYYIGPTYVANVGGAYNDRFSSLYDDIITA